MILTRLRITLIWNGIRWTKLATGLTMITKSPNARIDRLIKTHGDACGYTAKSKKRAQLRMNDRPMTPQLSQA